MREGVLRINAEHRAVLSNDLGAIGLLLFDVGSGRYVPALRTTPRRAAWEADLKKVRDESAAVVKDRRTSRAGGPLARSGAGIWLRDLGRSLGFDGWVAANDRNRAVVGGRLCDGCVDALRRPWSHRRAEAIRLIDVLWLEQAGGATARRWHE